MSQDPLDKILALAVARGLKGIKNRPGLTHIPIDDQWEVWINPHKNADLTPDGASVPPFHFYIEFNGWPAALFHPTDDKIIFAAGEAANIETFCAAVDEAIKREARNG